MKKERERDVEREREGVSIPHSRRQYTRIQSNCT